MKFRNEKYSIQKLTEGELEKITDLFNIVRNRSVDNNFFNKKYLTDWNSNKLFGSLLFQNEKLIGFCGSTLYNFKSSESKVLTVAQLGDLIISPEQQGKGLFTELLSHLESEFHNDNELDALIVFPNKNAQSIFENRDAWIQNESFYQFNFKVKTYPFLKLLNITGRSKWFYAISTILGAKKLSSSVWKKNLTNDEVGIEYNAAYFQYKTYQNYSFLNYNSKELIWSLSDGLLINATQVSTINELTDEIDFLKKYCVKRGIHQFSYICHPSTIIYKLLAGQKEGQEIIPTYQLKKDNCKNVQIKLRGFDRNAY